MAVSSYNRVLVLVIVILHILCGFVYGDRPVRGQEYNVKEEGKSQKSYEEDEEGKIVPHRWEDK